MCHFLLLPCPDVGYIGVLIHPRVLSFVNIYRHNNVVPWRQSLGGMFGNCGLAASNMSPSISWS